MKKVYYDATKLNECIAFLSTSAQILPAGATIYSMPCKHKNDVYERFAKEFDVRFIFDDNIPIIDFYTIPQVDIFATDSFGGFIATLGRETDLDCDAPICYVDKNRGCYLIANNGSDFLSSISVWKSLLTPYCDVFFYSSIIEAQKEFEFIDANAQPNSFQL